jgi:diadenosine tetraphosphate (Ap4A) HIT family hydrolase
MTENSSTPTICEFCELINHAAEKSIIFKNEIAVVLVPRRLRTIGDLIVLPKKHVSSMIDLTCKEQHLMIEACKIAASKIERLFDPDGLNISWNFGQIAGQGIDHLSIDLITRGTKFSSDESIFKPILEVEQITEEERYRISVDHFGAT